MGLIKKIKNKIVKKVRNKPSRVILEMTNHCNLNCPFCMVGMQNELVKQKGNAAHSLMSREMGYMSEETFTKVAKELKDLVASLAIDTKKMEEQVKANDEKLARMGFRLGAIQQNNGDITEEYFFKSIEHTIKLGDISFDYIDRSLFRHKKKQNIQGEYDMILVNGSTVAFIETKYKMHEKDILKVKDVMIPKFKALFPEYKDYKLFAGVASFHMNNKVKELAKEFGFYVLEKVGDVLQTNNENIHAY